MREITFTTEEKIAIEGFFSLLNSQNRGNEVFTIDQERVDESLEPPLQYFVYSSYRDFPEDLSTSLIRCFQACMDDIPPMDENYKSGEIIIIFDLKFKKIVCKYKLNHMDSSGLFTKTIKKEDDPELELILKDFSRRGDDCVEIPFSGGGDNGALQVPIDRNDNYFDSIEDWCYRALDKADWAWINSDRSEGRLIFSVEKGTCEMEYTSWGEEQKEITLTEISF